MNDVADLDDILAVLHTLTEDQVRTLVADMPDALLHPVLGLLGSDRQTIPDGPFGQAVQLEPALRHRSHLDYLSDRIANAVHRVESGQNVHMCISLPPRAGKSTLLSTFTPLWLLRLHPEWKIITASYDGNLTGEWARDIRGMIQDHGELGIALQKDAGAGTRWNTDKGGGMFASSVRSALTGRGANVLLIDDPIKDDVEANSPVLRKNLWQWWLTTAQTRLEPPYLVMVIATRWHEDDLIGRLQSTETEGDPRDWDIVAIPAIAETHDPLGRAPGEPLILPHLNETKAQATVRWNDVRRNVGEYTFTAMYQQKPAPAQGAIFNVDWFRYWTTNPELATDDGKVRLIDTLDLIRGLWIDSWDMAFKATDTSDYVVGQRWCKLDANVFLWDQVRARMDFVRTVQAVREFKTRSFGEYVYTSLVEEKANGAAVMSVLHDEMSGLTPVLPKESKEARASAVTPPFESGNVYFPHPSHRDWVDALTTELRAFPTGAHDDMVDTLTQALNRLRDAGVGRVTNPATAAPIPLNRLNAGGSMRTLNPRSRRY